MDEPPSGTPAARAGAWAVHAYTALGVVAAFAAVLAIIEGEYRGAFLWLAAAACIDATDGMLARFAQVAERTPAFDGGRLDDIVDYLTYVFVPVLLLHQTGSLPQGLAPVIAALVLLSSAYGFASADAKSDDGYFTGFPSYWNIVAVYLVAGGLPPAINGAVLVVFSGLVFVRVKYVYPTRTPILRALTMTLGGIWAAAVIVIILMMPDVPGALLVGSLFFPVYYTVLSFSLHRRHRQRA